jgi:hypothetical protein
MSFRGMGVILSSTQHRFQLYIMGVHFHWSGPHIIIYICLIDTTYYYIETTLINLINLFLIIQFHWAVVT